MMVEGVMIDVDTSLVSEGDGRTVDRDELSMADVALRDSDGRVVNDLVNDDETIVVSNEVMD